MGVIGQLPGSPDELPGREISSGEPPFELDRGPRADELPTITAVSHTIALSAPRPSDPVAHPAEDEPAED